MAFPGPAAAHEHAVQSIRESSKDKFQIDSARAHQPDDPYVRGILITGNSGKVRPRVATPVAQEPYDLWLELVRHSSVTPQALISACSRSGVSSRAGNAASIWAKISSLVKGFREMAAVGHLELHRPSPLQRMGFTLAFLPVGVSWKSIAS